MSGPLSIIFAFTTIIRGWNEPLIHISRKYAMNVDEPMFSALLAQNSCFCSCFGCKHCIRVPKYVSYKKRRGKLIIWWNTKNHADFRGNVVFVLFRSRRSYPHHNILLKRYKFTLGKKPRSLCVHYDRTRIRCEKFIFKSVQVWKLFLAIDHNLVAKIHQSAAKTGRGLRFLQ